MSSEGCGLCKGQGYVELAEGRQPCPQCARNEAARIAFVQTQLTESVAAVKKEMDIIIDDMIRLSNEWSRRNTDFLRQLLKLAEEVKATITRGGKV